MGRALHSMMKRHLPCGASRSGLLRPIMLWVSWECLSLVQLGLQQHPFGPVGALWLETEPTLRKSTYRTLTVHQWSRKE